MRIHQITSIIIVLALATTALGQRKVGSSSSNFINLSPSVQSNGMGGAGVALTDAGSPFYNPASVGFVDDITLARISFLPTRAEIVPIPYVPGLGYVSVTTKILGADPENGKNLSLGAAFYRTNVFMGVYEETTEAFPDGTGRGFDVSLTTTNLSLGASLDWSVDIGVGVTAKWVHEKVFEVNEDHYMFDVGFIVRKPVTSSNWHVEPSIGLSWSNYGPDIEYNVGFSGGDVRPSSIGNTFETPKVRRIGVACPIALVNPDRYGGWTTFSVTPILEFENLLVSDKSRTRIGFEVSLYEALTVRGGNASASYPAYYPLDPDFDLNRYPVTEDLEKTYNASSWGFSVSSRGIARLVGHPSSGGDHFLQDRFDVSFSFASTQDINNIWWSDERQTSYGITISY